MRQLARVEVRDVQGRVLLPLGESTMGDGTMKPTVYQRIMRADERGTGMRLSVEDVTILASEHGIMLTAALDDEGRDAEWCGECHRIWPDKCDACLAEETDR